LSRRPAAAIEINHAGDFGRRQIFEQFDAEVSHAAGQQRGDGLGALCGTALNSVLRQPTSAISRCSTPVRSRSLTL